MQGRLFLRRVLNKTHAAVTFPAAMATLHHLGFKDHLFTHTTAYHPYQAHTRSLTQKHHHTHEQQHEQQQQQEERVQHSQDADGSLRLCQSTDDYTHRAGLHEHSPYLVTAWYEKVKIDKRCAAHCWYMKFSRATGFVGPCLLD